jgi:glycine betaine catabolism A
MDLRFDGRLLAAPNIVEMPDLQKEFHGLVAVETETWGGYLWCCLDPDAGPLATQLEPQIRDRPGSTDVLDAYRLDELAVGHTVVYEVTANWKTLVESFTERCHLSQHPP